MDDITIYRFFEHEALGTILVVNHNYETWFLARDVCRALGYSRTWDVINRICDKEGIRKFETPTELLYLSDVKGSEFRMMNYISFENLLRLFRKSKKPKARPFKDWIYEDVLPTIRRTGGYSFSRKPSNEKIASILEAFSKVMVENPNKKPRRRKRKLPALMREIQEACKNPERDGLIVEVVPCSEMKDETDSPDREKQGRVVSISKFLSDKKVKEG